MTFEGVELEAPANPDVFLWSRYDYIMQHPKDIYTHFEHVDHDELETGETAASWRYLLSEGWKYRRRLVVPPPIAIN